MVLSDPPITPPFSRSALPSDAQGHRLERTYTGSSVELGGRATQPLHDIAGLAMRARLEARLFPDLEPSGGGPRIGRYEVLRRVGVGGMGEVFEAFDPQLQRTIALKVLHADLSAQCRIRLQREATALARLSHPNIAHVYEVGTSGDIFYLAMEFVPGVTLSTWQREGGRSWRSILEMYVAAGAALQTAHDAGIVHRDFKPTNVMVRPDGRVCVLDFGLARAIHTDETDEPFAADSNEHAATLLSDRLTITGSTMGTPAYMSPEQMMAQPVDAASDQFSFCVALWEALYGDRPYRGETVTELLRSLVLEELQSPPRSPWRPPWLRHALARGLALQPEKRYPSMSALVAALSSHGQGRTRWVAGGLLAVFAVGGSMLAMNPTASPCPPAQETVEELLGPRARATRQAAFKSTELPYYANALADAESRLTQAATRWSEAYATACEAATPSSATPEDRARIACLEHRLIDLQATAETLAHAVPSTLQRLPWVLTNLDQAAHCDDPWATPLHRDRQATRLLSDAAARLASGSFAEAERAARAARRRADELEDASLRAESLRWLGRIAAEREAWAEAVPLLQDALETALAAGDRATAFDASLDLADIHRKRSELERASETLRRAQIDLLAVDSGEGPRAARLALALGQLEAQRGVFDAAFDALERAEKLTATLFGERSIENAVVLKAIGDAQLDADHPRLAMQYYERAQELAVALLGDDYPLVAGLSYEIGTIHLQDGNFALAHAHLERAENVYARSAPDFIGARAIVLTARASTYLAQERYAEAILTAEHVDDLLLRHGEPRHRTRIPALLVRLSALIAQHRVEDALLGYVALVGLVEAERDWPRLCAIHANVADLMLEVGRPREAKEHLEKALLRLEPQFPAHALPLAHLHHSLAVVHLRLGDLEAAEAALLRAEACLADAAHDDPEALVPRALVAELRLRWALARRHAPEHVHAAAVAAQRSFEAAALPVSEVVQTWLPGPAPSAPG